MNIKPQLDTTHVFQWCPPGPHPTGTGRDLADFPVPVVAIGSKTPKSFIAEPSAVDRLNKYLSFLRDQAMTPVFDAEHDFKRKIAIPHIFFWGGNDKWGGIMVQVEWTWLGLNWIRSGKGKFFSPALAVGDDGLIHPAHCFFENLGAFTDTPALKNIRPVLEDPDHARMEKRENTPERLRRIGLTECEISAMLAIQ